MKRLFLFLIFAVLTILSSSQLSPTKAQPAVFLETDTPDTDALIQGLLDQGVLPDCIVGVDPDGIPIICHDEMEQDPESLIPSELLTNDLPPGTRGYEIIPNVIRADGIESLRIEVNTNGPAAGVHFYSFTNLLIFTGVPPATFRDDGLGADQVAGDNIYTVGPFVYNTFFPMQPYFRNDPVGPSGLNESGLGTIIVDELDGSSSQFLVQPSVGILHPDIPVTTMTALSPDIVVSPHLINIRSNDRITQKAMRAVGGNLALLTIPIYEVVPDAFDWFMFFSTYKIERLPFLTYQNFTAGIHYTVQVNYTGTGFGLFDNSANYGSDGKLMGLNAMDFLDRGIYSGNATHEIVHQWASFTSPVLGLSDSTGHYKGRSNATSIVGGFEWIPNGDGSYTLNCDIGRNGIYHVPPIDKYMMGLIDGSQVAPLMAYSESSPAPGLKCAGGEPILESEIEYIIPIEDIQSVHGMRTPGPSEAQRDFNMAFVAESIGRLFTPTEMTFYEILAAHYTTSVPPGDPDPFVGFNWAPIDRAFGEGTTWSSEIPSFDVAGVSITPTSSSDSGTPGETVVHEFQVTNTGTVTDTYDIVLGGNIWAVSSPASIGPVAVGASATFQVSVGIPTDVELGDSDTVQVTATSQTNSNIFDTATALTIATSPGNQVWTVCANGCDFPAIQAGVNAAGPNDTLLVAGETFYENVTINKDLTIQGSSPETTRVNGSQNGSVFHIHGPYHVTIRDLTVTNGLDEGSGGGIRNLGGNVTVTNVILTANSANIGGGIANMANGTMTVNNSVISENSATLFGGGITNCGSCTMTINVSTLIGNSANNGGGINNGGIIYLNNSTLSENSVEAGGGGIGNGGTINIENSTLNDNSAGTYGGGIANGYILNINNSTLSGNTAGTVGGGIFNSNDGQLTLINDTLSANSALQSGSGIHNNGVVTLMNTILTRSNPGGECSGPGTFTGSHNLIDDATCGFPANPVTSIDRYLADNGGLTLTIALFPDSNAIGAGDPAVCSTPPINNLDQRGFPRNEACDIGAFEWQSTHP